MIGSLKILLTFSLGIISRWSAKLPGRTDNEIKNVWHTHFKKRLEEYLSCSTIAKPPLLPILLL